jgi:hypothetical protein
MSSVKYVYLADHPMKRVGLINELEGLGCELVRHGG